MEMEDAIVSPTTAAERAEMRAMARELAYRELAPRAASLDAGEEAVLAECWRLLAELGLDRVLIDERHGGAGLGVADLLATIEELAVGDGGIAMCVFSATPRWRRSPASSWRTSPRGHAGRLCRPRPRPS